MDHESTPYADLTPDIILDAIDQSDILQAGFQTSGQLLALNSYENRVYQVGLEDLEGNAAFIIAKFYRPWRWSDETILEEHQFAHELASHDIPVVAPMADPQHHTLLHYKGYRFALFPRRGGHSPELDDAETLRQLGRFLGRMHAVGARQAFSARPQLSPQHFGHDALTYLLDNNVIPAELRHNYQAAAESILEQIDKHWQSLLPLRNIRLHGDCHPGNILWTDQGPHFVDLDDCLSGPAIQDLWMLVSGDQANMSQQFRYLLEGYETFYEFDRLELALMESLRSLRILNYSAWLAKRWHDPAFPQAFPWFNTPRYWEEQLYTLREQQERLLLPTLKI